MIRSDNSGYRHAAAVPWHLTVIRDKISSLFALSERKGIITINSEDGSKSFCASCTRNFVKMHVCLANILKSIYFRAQIA